jgi:LemA protein
MQSRKSKKCSYSTTSATRDISIKVQEKEKSALSGTLKSIFALSENYPNLKANQNFLELQIELTDTENKIQTSRGFYNSNILSLNTKLNIFSK